MKPARSPVPAALALAAGLAGMAAAADVLALAGYRDWTATDGRKLHAQLLAVGPNAYTLKSRRDGRTYDIPLDRIGDADRQLVSAANAEVDRAKARCMADGAFRGLPDPSEAFWRVALALGRANELGELVAGAYRSSTGVIKLPARGFRRESDKSFLIEGEHVMVRIVVPQEGDSVQVSGEKLQVVRKTRVTESRSTWYGWEYDTRLKLLRRPICTRREVYQPTVGDAEPCKVAACAVEAVGVGNYLVFTLHVNFK